MLRFFYRRSGVLQVKLQRERLELSPVFSTALKHEDHQVGYIRLASFSQKAAGDLKRHVDKLEVRMPLTWPQDYLGNKAELRRLCSVQRDGAEAYILDLRNNPGGLVRVGLDVARIFLDGPAAIFNVSGRDSASYPSVLQACRALGPETLRL